MSSLDSMLNIILGTEIWSLIFVFMVQDGPFFIIRLIILLTYDLEKNYMIYFLVVKNFILISIELFRIYIIYINEKNDKTSHE